MLFTEMYLSERTIFIKLISNFSNCGFSAETSISYLYTVVDTKLEPPTKKWPLEIYWIKYFFEIKNRLISC